MAEDAAKTSTGTGSLQTLDTKQHRRKSKKESDAFFDLDVNTIKLPEDQAASKGNDTNAGQSNTLLMDVGKIHC